MVEAQKASARTRARFKSRHDIKSISKLVRSKQPDALIHIDAIQSFMKMPLNIESSESISSASARIRWAAKGIGALILGKRFENRNPKLGAFLADLRSSRHASWHDPRAFDRRVPFRSRMGHQKLDTYRKHVGQLREQMAKALPAEAIINGPSDVSASSTKRIPQTLNFSVPGLPSSVAVEALSARGYCVSARVGIATPQRQNPAKPLRRLKVGRGPRHERDPRELRPPEHQE